ncbi:hypothetical protein NHY66_15460 [Acinetobacter baumannii]|nr:hypothetical protein NHY66_15460 [Acinetobacter baumannii]
MSVASSLLCREPHLDIVIIDPADTHYYINRAGPWSVVVFSNHK